MWSNILDPFKLLIRTENIDISSLQPVIGITMILGIIKLIFLITLLNGFHKKTKYILKIFKQYTLFHFIYIIPESAIIFAVIVGGEDAKYLTIYDMWVWVGVTAYLILNIIIYRFLYLYLLKSRRSKNTFTIDINPWIPIPK